MYPKMLLSTILTFAICVLSSHISKRTVPSGVLEYVTRYAPIVHLYSTDTYRPADIGAILTHTQPEIKFTAISPATTPLTLDNLNKSLSAYNGGHIYLTSTTDITTKPTWLNGIAPNGHGKTEGAVSSAIIVNDHGSGFVDVFYMYFYAFDYGGKHVGHEVGDHVGDWEHNMVRFQDGVPTSVWYSQHSNGEAFKYEAVQKWTDGLRPIVYSAKGTHANYATKGTHDHTIPNINLPIGPAEDHTDKGPIWDPTLSAYYYTYNASNSSFAAYDSSTPVDWLYFTGHWGDEQYPSSDHRQHGMFGGLGGLYKYKSGPTGPEDKQLNRTEVCPDKGYACEVRPMLGA